MQYFTYLSQRLPTAKTTRLWRYLWFWGDCTALTASFWSNG